MGQTPLRTPVRDKLNINQAEEDFESTNNDQFYQVCFTVFFFSSAWYLC